MARRKRLKEPKEHITRDTLLALLKAGAVLTVAFTAPNALRLLSPLVGEEKQWEQYYPSSIARHTLKLWRNGFVDVYETESGYVVKITEKGRTEILRYDLESMTIPKQEPWDRRWRMVFFDIPASHEARNIFRESLLSMGFFKMQKSVYVHPFPCRKQIQFLREVYDIPHSVKFATVDFLENDEDLRRFFRLPSG